LARHRRIFQQAADFLASNRCCLLEFLHALQTTPRIVFSVGFAAPGGLKLGFPDHEIWSVNILSKIIKIVATRCQIKIFRLECTKFDFGWGSAQNPLGELTAPQTPSWV